ncbi:acyltransferase [Nocardioides panacihumi]|uniref:Acyltransferase n=1 Tax=Nocardioides panacihumi TaxID=400774 RepID=A0ABP5CDK7_9ACTN
MTATPVTDTMTVKDRRSVTALPALDTMRAIAAIAVLATHASFWGGAYARPHYGTALSRLDIGVAVFFVLSGFLLTRPWFTRHDHGYPAPSTRTYLWRRVLRVMPVYLIAAVAALVLLPGNNDASPATWLKTLTLTNIYFDGRLPDGLTQMWSLGTEAAFYLVLPLLLWLALSRRRDHGHGPSRLSVVLAAMVLVNVAWLAMVSSGLELDGTMMSLWLPSYLTWFAVGMLIAACAVRTSDAPDTRGAAATSWLAEAVRRMGQAPGACWTAGLALFAIASTPIAGPALLIPPTLGEALGKNLLYAAIAGLLILPGVYADPRGRYARAMSWRPFRHLGHLSYGIFCVHLVILELVWRWRDMELFHGRTLELFTITLAMSVVVSEILYRLVELPSMRWKSLFDRPPSSVSATITPRPANTSS